MGGTKVTYNPPPPPPKDEFPEKYLAYQQKKDEDRDYLDWTKNLQGYQTKKSQQQTGRQGWQDFKSGVHSQLGQGLMTFSQAKKELTDYADKYNLAGGIAGPGDDPRKNWERYQTDGPEGGFTQLPDYQTPDAWKNWSVQGALNKLQTAYTGSAADDVSTPDIDESLGIRGKRNLSHIKAAHEELYGEPISAADLAKAQEGFKSGYYKDVQDYRTGITSSKAYKDRFHKSYLENYYDSEFGEALKDAEGKSTKQRTFNFDKSLLPQYAEGLEGKTGITTPNFKDKFTGTPSEIKEQIQNVRDTRKFLYSAGLTNLQGDIDKETQKLKNEGGREIARIGKEGDIYQSVVSAFNF